MEGRKDHFKTVSQQKDKTIQDLEGQVTAREKRIATIRRSHSKLIQTNEEQVELLEEYKTQRDELVEQTSNLAEKLEALEKENEEENVGDNTILHRPSAATGRSKANKQILALQEKTSDLHVDLRT